MCCRKITFKQVDALIAEVAKAYAKDTGKSEADSVAEIKDKLSKVSGPVATGVTVSSIVVNTAASSLTNWRDSIS